MRITNNMIVNHAIVHMNDNRELMNLYNERAGSGKMFQSFSEDPSQAAIAIKLKSTMTANLIYIETDNITNEWISANDSAFKQMIDVATRANTLALQGKPDTLSANERYALGAELDALLRQAVEVSNTQHDGKSLFAGSQVKTIPFTLTDTTDANGTLISTIQYNGDRGVLQQDISPGQKVTTNFNGESTFSQFFTALTAVRDVLLQNKPEDIDAALGALQSATETVKIARTTNGARQRQVRLVLDTMQNTKAELKSLLSKKEDANMAEAISMLTQQQNVYQTVLEVSGRAISQVSLFEMLR